LKDGEKRRKMEEEFEESDRFGGPELLDALDKLRRQNPSDVTFVEDVVACCLTWAALGAGVGMTSSITGGGAVGAVEEVFSAAHYGRPALLVPSATYGMRAALLAAGVRPGDIVLLPAYDWPASLAAVRSVGATPRFAPVEADTLTMDAAAVADTGLEDVKAIVVCHIHGTAADVPRLKRLAGPGIPIIEDCAQALGCSFGDCPVGTDGDFAVFSFGPSKIISVGEGGMVLTKDRDGYMRLLREACHPVRQTIGGVVDTRADNFSVRPHPVTAAMLFVKFVAFMCKVPARHEAFSRLAAELSGVKGLRPLGADGCRRSAADRVPIRLENGVSLPADLYDVIESGAFDLTTMRPAANGVKLAGRPRSACAARGTETARGGPPEGKLL
jgi:dTDP-4-amino-4,6-dideoxygalactose transaminase